MPGQKSETELPEVKRKKAETAKLWHAKHPGYAAAASAKYAKAHPEILKAWRKANPDYKKTWRAAHPGYEVAATLKWKKANPEKAKRVAVAAAAKWKKANPTYVAPRSSTEYHKISREKAAGRKKPMRCDVCKKSGRRICFDHCHKSNKFRGWLCLQCNAVLGHANDSPKLLRRLADYLMAPKGARNGKKPKRCDVCKKNGRRICFDHCHKSKKFRGWLCHQCNVVLGYAGDSPKLLRKLADYLEKSKRRGA